MRRRLTAFLNTVDARGRRPANAQRGVSVCVDYDGEPISVGQTYEKVRSRIGRHLARQPTDAVAMNVLDPFEVAAVEIYPFYEFEHAD